MLQALRKMRRSKSFVKFVRFHSHLILTSQLDSLRCALTMKRFQWTTINAIGNWNRILIRCCCCLQLHDVHARCKLSNEELRNAAFIIEHRNDERGDDVMRSCAQTFSLLGGESDKYLRFRMQELIKYWGEAETLKKFEAWRAPELPVNGRDLVEAGVQRGPAMAWIIEQLRLEFARSDFQASRDVLLQSVQTLSEQANNMSFKSNKRKRSRDKKNGK